MFKRLCCHNYRSLVNFEIELDELNLLLGRNGSGKTSVLDAVFALCRLLDGSAKVTDDGIFPVRTLTRWQINREQAFELDVEPKCELQGDFLGVLFTYRLEVEHEETSRRSRIIRESLTESGQPLFQFERGVTFSSIGTIIRKGRNTVPIGRNPLSPVCSREPTTRS